MNGRITAGLVHGLSLTLIKELLRLLHMATKGVGSIVRCFKLLGVIMVREW